MFNNITEANSNMKTLSLISAAAVFAVSTSANAWWGPFDNNNGYNNNNSNNRNNTTNGDGSGDFDSSFSFGMKASGNGRGNGNGYSNNNYRGQNGYNSYNGYNGYAPQGNAPVAPAVAPAQPEAPVTEIK